MKYIVRVFLFAFSFALAAGAPAAAWEGVFGPPPSEDEAARGVQPVQACGLRGPGYISVGTHNVTGAPDVYVVLTDLLGNAVWEQTYDIQGGGRDDEGVDIVPVPGGYVFLSNTWNFVWRPALTFINCDGTVGWTRIYYDMVAGYDLRGNDLIRTQSGDTAWGTAPGDLAVAGVWWNGGNEDGFLMRTDANGILIWNVAHNTNFPEAFHALAEALPFGTSLTGDLVAVGRWSDYMGNQDGLVARVSGNNGMIGPLPQCLQHHGQPGSNEVYNSVVRLQNIFPGQFAMVGTTSNSTWLDDVWVTRGNPCALAAQARIGNPGGTPTSEHGNDIIEILVPKPLGGSLAVAGDFGLAAGGPYEATLLVLNAGFLPTGASSRRFGDFGVNQETFTSLAEDPAGWPVTAPGYILAGLTRTPWVPDPQDLYLVHDDPTTIVCEKGWNPGWAFTSFPQTSLPSAPVVLANHFWMLTPALPVSSGLLICTP